MVLLRLTVKIPPPDVVQNRRRSTSNAQAKPTSFLLVIRDPEQLTLGELTWMITDKWSKLRPEAGPLQIKKLLDDEHDTHDLDLELSVADVFVDNGKAARDGLDQRAAVRVVQAPTTKAPTRYGSVVQDWNAVSDHYARINASRARPPVPLFPGVSQSGLTPGYVLPGTAETSSRLTFPVPEVAESEYHGDDDDSRGRRNGEMSPVLGDDHSSRRLDVGSPNTILIPSLASGVRLSLDAQSAALRDLERAQPTPTQSSSAEKPVARRRSGRVSLIDRLSISKNDSSPSARATTRGSKRRRSSFKPDELQRQSNELQDPPPAKRQNTSKVEPPRQQGQSSPASLPIVVIPVDNTETGKSSVEGAPVKPTQELEFTKELSPSLNESLVEAPTNEKPAESDQQHDNHVHNDFAAPRTNTTELPSTPVRHTKYPSPFVPATDLLPVQPEPQTRASSVDNGVEQQAKEPQNGFIEEAKRSAGTGAEPVPLGEQSSLQQGDPMDVDTPAVKKTPKDDATKNPAETKMEHPSTPSEERPSDNSIIVVESSDSENQVAPPSAQRQTRRLSIQGPQPKAVPESPAKTPTGKGPAKSTSKRRPSIQGVEMVDLISRDQTEKPASLGPGPGQMGLGITRSPPKPKRQTAKRREVSAAELYRRTNVETPSPPHSQNRRSALNVVNGSPKASKRANHVDTINVDSETSATESEVELWSRIGAAEAEGKPIRVVSQMEEVLGMMKQLRSAKKENNGALVAKLERQLKARKLTLEGQPKEAQSKTTEKSNSEHGIISTAPKPAQNHPPTAGHAANVASSSPRPGLLPSPVVDTRPMTSPGSGKPLKAEVPLVRGKKLFKNLSQPNQQVQGTQEESAAGKGTQKNENDKEPTPEYSSSSSEPSTQSEAESAAESQSDRVSKGKQTKSASESSEFDDDDESAFENMSTPQASNSKTTKRTKPTDNAVSSSSESSGSSDSESDDGSNEEYQSAASKEASVESEVSASEQPTSSAAKQPPPKTKTNRKTDVDISSSSSSSSDSADSDDSDVESAGGDIPFIPRSKKTQSPRVTATAALPPPATRGRARHGLGRARNGARSGTNDTKVHPASSPFAQREKTELVTFSQPANRRQSSIASDATPGRRTRTTLKALKDQMRQA